MSQLEYRDPFVANEGMKADLGVDDVISRNAEGALPFGKLAVLGTDLERQAKVPGASTDITVRENVLGVAIQSHAKESGAVAGAESPRYDDTEMASIMRMGRVYVKPEVAVVVGDPVFVRHIAAGNEELGAFRNDADGGDADQLPDDMARWVKGSDADGFAVLQLNID